jgi:hypothetical protein
LIVYLIILLFSFPFAVCERVPARDQCVDYYKREEKCEVNEPVICLIPVFESEKIDREAAQSKIIESQEEILDQSAYLG